MLSFFVNNIQLSPIVSLHFGRALYQIKKGDGSPLGIKTFSFVSKGDSFTTQSWLYWQRCFSWEQQQHSDAANPAKIPVHGTGAELGGGEQGQCRWCCACALHWLHTWDTTGRCGPEQKPTACWWYRSRSLCPDHFSLLNHVTHPHRYRLLSTP